jgi:short-subunit dehydrogenase
MKKAIVIGATSGIGRELAMQLSRAGYSVGATGRRVELLDSLHQQSSGKIITTKADVTNINQQLEALTNLVEKLGGLDLLIYSSGTGILNDKLDYDAEKRTIDTNVDGFTAVINWAFHYFSNQGFGHIANISSVAGIRGSRFAPAYSATKAFQINYLEALYAKCHKDKLKITVTDIRPGFVDTAMAQSPILFWKAPVEKATGQILQAINRKDRVVYITNRWRLMAFIFRLLPQQML